MAFKTMDDIERDKHREKRDKIKQEITEDVNDVIGNIFGKPKKNKNPIMTILKIAGIFILVIILINLILGNIWLLRFFLKSLFGVG